MLTEFDIAVVGAGPAGLSAAIEATAGGLSVVVLDEQSHPGGQIYRAIEMATPEQKNILGPDYVAGEEIVSRFRASGAVYLPQASVINVGTDRLIDYRLDGSMNYIRARSIVVAAGAFERPSPLPGWTLPGVTTAGAVQIMLKRDGLVPENLVLVGAGPLIWLVAAQLCSAGAPPSAIVETVPRHQTLASMRKLPEALRAISYLKKGLHLISKVRTAGVPIYHHASDIRAQGNTAVEGISFQSGGRKQYLATRSVALHQGVIPNQQISRLLLCQHFWDRSQHCFRPVLDDNFQTTMPGIYVVGDAAGISGAQAAILQGSIVGLHLAEQAGKPNNARMLQLRGKLTKETAIRPFLEALYAPARQILHPEDATIVCRCEDITAGSIRSRVAIGVPGSNQLKSMIRTGMGPCQGRVCGIAVSTIIAHARGEAPERGDYYRIRPPLKPLPLMELTAYPQTGAETEV